MRTSDRRDADVTFGNDQMRIEGVDVDIRSTPKDAQTSSTFDRRVTSSVLIPMVSSSTCRRLMPRPRAARRTFVGATRHPGQNGVEEVLVNDVQPGDSSPAATSRANRCVRCAIPRSPSGPWYTAYMLAMTASSTWAVQMLLVAFSRRMCCSRVCRAKPIGGRTVGVDRDPDEATRQLTFEAGPNRHVAGVRTAEAERDAEPLRGTHDDVGAHLTWWLEDGERQQVGHDDGLCPPLVSCGDQGLGVDDDSAARWVLKDQPGEVPGRQAFGAQVADVDLDPERPGARLQHRDRLREEIGIDHDQRAGRADARIAMVMASAAAVASSSSEAFAVGSPVRSSTIVWKLSSASSRPWLISGWYGV